MALTGEVIDLSGDGWGVVRAEAGRTYFVHGAWPGDLVEFEALEPHKKYSEARLIRVLRASADRREALPCPHQGYERGRCGGCPWMMATYPAQLRAKQRALEYLIDKHGLRGPGTVCHGVWPSPREFFFRNRAQFKTDGQKLGFVSQGTHEIVEVPHCQVLKAPLQEKLAHLYSQLPNAAWRPTSPHRWNFLDCDDDDAEVVLNRRRPFKQGNDEQNLRMKQWLRQRAEELDRDATWLELYAGSGNFTREIVAAGFRRVVAVEISAEALRQLQAESGVEVEAGDLSDAKKFRAWAEAHAELAPRYLLLDPPREGALGLEELTARYPSIEKIFYVSCDPRTWVRDVRRLADDFALSEVQPLDQFPHTPHLEILSVLEKIETKK